MAARANKRFSGDGDVFAGALRDQMADLHLTDTVTPEAFGRLERHWRLVQEWNGAANLTALTDARDAAVQLFADSLAGLHLINRHVPPVGDVLDIGSGGGFPGLALALCDPRRRYVLVDRNQKKAAFLRNAIRELGIAHRVQAVSRDISATGFPPGSWAVVTSKATFSARQWVSWASAFLAPDGFVMLYRRLDDAELSMIDPSLRIADRYEYSLHGLDNRRHITLVGRIPGATDRG